MLLGNRTYELTNQVGNVLATISDKKIGNDNSNIVNYYRAETLSQNDYYPFGMLQPARHYEVDGSYRYGFNGKENDNEVKGDGTTIAFENRIYDPRLGKWFSLDPLQKKYPGISPFAFVENNPVFYSDKDGKEKWLNFIIINQITGVTTQFSILVSRDIVSKVNRIYNPGDSYTDTYDWFDINLNVNITVNKNGKVSTSFSETTGDFRTNTWWNWKWYAKSKLSHKDTDIGEGYLLSGEGGGMGDPLSPGSQKDSSY